VAKIRVVDQVDIIMMYLIGGVKLWWRKMIKEDLNAEHSKIKIWDRFKQKLKEKFLSSNTSWIAREELKKLRHEKSVQEYVKSFISFILNIKNMFEEDKLSNFMLGLQL
jgi:ATP-dependent Lon protease